MEQVSYRSFGYDGFGIKSIETTRKQTPVETRNESQPGALIADGLYITTVDLPLKIDKDGIYLGSPVPDYAESRLRYNWTTHKLEIGGASGFEVITSV